MPDLLILQHVRPEPPGTIADALAHRELSYCTVKIFRDEPVPDTLDADGLVLMGGPMGVGDIGDRAHLSRELSLIEAALRDELADEGLDGAAIRRAAMTHEQALRDTARTVFGRWADLVVESNLQPEH